MEKCRIVFSLSYLVGNAQNISITLRLIDAVSALLQKYIVFRNIVRKMLYFLSFFIGKIYIDILFRIF